MRKRCTPSQSLNDMPCRDMSIFGDLIAPCQRYLTSSTFSQGMAKKVVQGQKLWFAVLEAQIETGNSYMLFKVCIVFSEWLEYYGHFVICNDNSQLKDELKACHVEWWASLILLITFYQLQDARKRKSSQPNLGTIKSSNLYTEIVEFTGPNETAVCNLASLCFIHEVMWPC